MGEAPMSRQRLAVAAVQQLCLDTIENRNTCCKDKEEMAEHILALLENYFPKPKPEAQP